MKILLKEKIMKTLLTLTLTIVSIIILSSVCFAGDYTVKLDTQGEELIAIAVKDWVKANTVTTNIITKKVVDGKEVEIVTPTETIPKMNNAQFIQKLIDDKLTETFNKVKVEKSSSIQKKYDSANETTKSQIDNILQTGGLVK